MSPELQARLLVQLHVQDFLVREAELLDHRRHRDWLDLLDDEIRYRIPARSTLQRARLEEEFTEADSGIAYMDETKETLTTRVAKLETGTAWAEVPPSRTRRLVTNVRVHADDGERVEVASSFYVYKSRLENTEDEYIGERRDVLRRVDESFRVLSRRILLDQTVLQVANISIFL